MQKNVFFYLKFKILWEETEFKQFQSLHISNRKIRFQNARKKTSKKMPSKLRLCSVHNTSADSEQRNLKRSIKTLIGNF